MILFLMQKLNMCCLVMNKVEFMLQMDMHDQQVRFGVCLGTSGPGATNLVTGIATAYMDSTPLVVLTGQVPTELIGGDVVSGSGYRWDHKTD